MKELIVFALFAILVVIQGQAPPYDHQTKSYYATHLPVSSSGTFKLTPFFSPDHSTDTEVALVESAVATIDIAIPSWSSWNGCSFANPNGCMGCTIPFLRANETFPVWQALVNAVHRGVRVRIITNGYGDVECTGMATPVTFLHLAGAQVRYFTTVTFLHTKYMQVDGKRAFIASINYSQASFLKNREAGVVIESSGAGVKSVDFLNQIFELDWAQGLEYSSNQQYSASDMAVVNDRTSIPVKVPTLPYFSCKMATPAPVEIVGYADVTVYASPDHSREVLLETLKGVTKTIQISIYQVTDMDICTQLLTMKQNGIDVQLLVSNVIYDTNDASAAAVCYDYLKSKGFTFRKTAPKCLTYSHQKYWIVDGHTVGLSSGNWSPTDIPDGSDTFTPYAQDASTWRKANRDFNILMTNPDIVQVYLDVFNLDYNQGYNY